MLSAVVVVGPGQLSGLLFLPPSFRQTHNTQVDIISFLWVAHTKNFLEFLFNLEINQQWGSGRWEAFLRPQEDDQICISQLNY